MALNGYEQETVINFNKAEKIAYIFTYEKTWQNHIEKRFKIKPVYDNGHGGKEYELPKDRIKKPCPKRRRSDTPDMPQKRPRTPFQRDKNVGQ